MINQPRPGTTKGSETFNIETSYYDSSVETALETLLDGIFKIPEITLETLLSAVLPQTSNTYYPEVCQKLVGNGSIRQERWVCMPTDPTNHKLKKDQAFELLSAIFDAILAAGGIETSLIKLTMNGSKLLCSDSATGSLPDAYLQLRTPSFSKISCNADPWADHWVDVVMPFEFNKKWNATKCDNDLRKVVWQMHHIMRVDPRRRFVFGLTIENRSGRLWFHDRCCVVASETFDIHSDWRTLVQIVLGLAMASPEDLGFDVYCHAVPSMPFHYDFTFETILRGQVQTTIFRTIEVISNHGAIRLFGHGTRVWRVQEVIDGRPQGHYYTLKDIWPHDDRDAEHVILADIKARIPEYQKYFLTIVRAEFIHSIRNGRRVRDHSTKTIRRGQAFVCTGHRLSTSHEPESLETQSTNESKNGGSKQTGRDSKSRNKGGMVVATT